MEKIVKFYRVFAEPSLSLNGSNSNSENIKKAFETIFDKPTSENIPYAYVKNGIQIRFDIKEKNENYIFGTFCKEEHFEKELLLQKVNSRGLKQQR